MTEKGTSPSDSKSRLELVEGAMGKVVAIFLWLFVAVVLWLTVKGMWRFPPLASAQGGDIDRLFYFIFAITGTAFVVANVLIGYFAWRFEHREGTSALHHGQRAPEWVWVLIPAAILLIFDLVIDKRSNAVWLKVHNPPKSAITVEVLAEQFAWNVRYPGKDGKFGRTDFKFVAEDNLFGLDHNDPAAKDDIVLMNEMNLPVNQTVLIRLRSKDVLHSFFVPHFRVKQDVVPGMTTKVWFTPTKTGDYEIACAELCGLGHYEMRAILTVQTQKEFEEWLSEQVTFGE